MPKSFTPFVTLGFFRHKNASIIAEFSDPGLELLDSDSNWSLQLESIKRLLDLAETKDIRITLFINPYHAEYLTAIDIGQKWRLLEQWKRIMVELTDQYDDVALWDFNQFNEYATERPPERGETGKMLRWFWEPAHYNKRLGDLMLANMLQTECGPADGKLVGSILTEKSIEQHLANMRSDLDQYKRTFPDVIERLNLVSRTLAKSSTEN